MGSGPNRKQIVDALRNTAQSASNMVAENASVPVDVLAWALRKAGVPIGDKPVMGSDWMREKGLTAPVQEGMSKAIGDTIGMVGPMGFSKAGSQALMEAGKKMKGLPVGLSIKDVSGAYPQAEALALAQQRAALPVEQGGLGLAPTNTAAERAAAMGFDTNMPLYHGTGADIKAFDPRMAGKNDRGLWGRGQYLTTSPESASSYALREGDGANIIPAYAAVKNPMMVTTGKDLITRMPDGTNTRELIGNNLDGAKIKEIAEAAGHDSVFQVKPNGNIGDIVTFNPENIRSRFAAFDPFRKTAAIAATMGVAAPDLLAQERNK